MASLCQIRNSRVKPLRTIPEGFDYSEGILREWEQTGQQKVSWVDPDTIFGIDPNCITFVFSKDGRLYPGDPETCDTHYDVMNRYPELRTAGNGRRGGLEAGHLMGRLGFIDTNYLGEDDKEETGNLISFWNTKPSDYDRLLIPCLEAIEKIGRLAPDVRISTPVHGTVPLAGIMGNEVESNELTPEEQEHWELARNMHLMRGDQKRDAMKKLGVGGGGTPHPMQKAMDDAGLRVPGQKWWAPTSEDFDRKLSMALICLW